jgi:hypothetical protein
MHGKELVDNQNKNHPTSSTAALGFTTAIPTCSKRALFCANKKPIYTSARYYAWCKEIHLKSACVNRTITIKNLHELDITPMMVLRNSQKDPALIETIHYTTD